ncbi:MAG: sigma-54 dependent transcriptional regulator [Thermodesulfovibrionia bacterium]
MTKPTRATVLVVDDEEDILNTLSEILEDEGYEVITAPSGEEAITRFKEFSPDVVLLDVWLPGIDGIEVLKRIKEGNHSTPVIMISGHGNIDTAIKAVNLGAYNFLEKPLTLEKVLIVVRNAVEMHELEKRLGEEKWEIVGESPVMIELKETIKKIAPSQSRVLIFGESGTGKELVARAIHNESNRRNKNFVEVNCAAIPHELIESELFGHEKGSFTGAFERKKGKFEMAHEGTLFLDEIGDMSLTTQAKVLRVIETQEFQRVGGNKNIKVDVRIVSATNKNLQEEIKNANFREDLYFRLNVIPIYIPPLRERKDDIPLLAEYFLNHFAQQYGQKPKRLTRSAIQALMNYDWPGNVRELKNTIERFVIMNPTEIIDIGSTPLSRNESTNIYEYKTLREARENFERNFILRKLREHNWNVSKTAEEMEIERSNLHRKIKSLGITIP